jgi:hypothetical protein
MIVDDVKIEKYSMIHTEAKQKVFVEFDDDASYDTEYMKQEATIDVKYVRPPIITTPIDVKPKMFIVSLMTINDS